MMFAATEDWADHYSQLDDLHASQRAAAADTAKNKEE